MRNFILKIEIIHEVVIDTIECRITLLWYRKYIELRLLWLLPGSCRRRRIAASDGDGDGAEGPRLAAAQELPRSSQCEPCHCGHGRLSQIYFCIEVLSFRELPVSQLQSLRKRGGQEGSPDRCCSRLCLGLCSGSWLPAPDSRQYQ